MEIEINFQLIFVLYLVLLIHELGHVIAIKLIGGDFLYVSLGHGPELWSFKKFRINKYFFIFRGYTGVNYKENQSKFELVFFFLNGILFSTVIWLIINLFWDNSFVQEFNFCFYVLSFTALLPINYPIGGNPSDFKQVLDLYRKV
ncbi:hypothetical protein CKN99_15955 [Carnobacterium maltaromaticum]|uniref:site-2 protease family protein n=1 Tax=Carnobacterium maltaromaticum TaxID=2751 RepID=UPI000704FCA3|nr:site-2 protease family protein [Carnobacterium maltaromaticum]MDT1943401.1 site-2 protease family protein [Carnobacterium maltaromaticum]MDT1998781.1 site-2 protease family protein [Carnobacterium maltaromaticum]TFJ24773.1 hypothetical protein CKN90_15915 [Carnobacterium maltaromaticum]TFJ30178.1 hypothetical protein CKN98_15920 [Carnobacterium maltaromaticum]TFJ33317.1 hypothetical protein CKN88_15880 [Carnobacterium maltaromaticum]